jgi:hypothetical protein
LAFIAFPGPESHWGPLLPPDRFQAYEAKRIERAVSGKPGGNASPGDPGKLNDQGE